MVILLVLIFVPLTDSPAQPKAYKGTIDQQIQQAIKAQGGQPKIRRQGTTIINPVFGNAVGYQPIIVTLPEGANLGVSAVVSGDRRYVRISTVPMFSTIPKWHTFNTTTGITKQYINK